LRSTAAKKISFRVEMLIGDAAGAA
jgi:hypothetical protein